MPWRHQQRIARLCASAMACGWGLAYGVVEVVQTVPDLAGLPWIQIGIGAAISSWGGATATLGRYLTAAYDTKPFCWRAEIVRDAAVSVTVGAAAYMAGAWYQVGPLALGLVLLLSGYAGVKVLTTAVDRLLSILVTKPL